MRFTYEDAGFAPSSLVIERPSCAEAGWPDMQARNCGALSWEDGYDVGAFASGSMRAFRAGEGVSVCVSDFLMRQDVVQRETRVGVDLYQFGCCLEGSMSWRVEGGSEQIVDAGDVVVQHVSDGECESALAGGQPCRTVSVMVQGSRLRSLVPKDVLNTFDTAVATMPLSVEANAVARTIWGHQGGGWADRMMLEAKALELVSQLLGELAAGSCCARPADVLPDDFAALLAAKRCLEGHLEERITIADLSRRVYLNECKLKRGFKRCFGLTIQEYRRRCRMYAARDLIVCGGLRVKDVAWKVGYSNVSHFIEAYRKEFGATPTGR